MQEVFDVTLPLAFFTRANITTTTKYTNNLVITQSNMFKYSVFFLSLAALFFGAIMSAAEINQALQRQLIDMGHKDQAIREKIVPVMSAKGLESDEFKRLAKEMAAIDSENMSALKTIIKDRGWPGSNIVGEEAAKAAFLILQHASLQDQEEFLPLFKTAVSEGNALPRNLALLEDRVRLAKGLKQLYGSQVSAGPDGVVRLDPIENPETVNQRREAIGLPPIEEYLTVVEEQLGKKIDRSALLSN